MPRFFNSREPSGNRRKVPRKTFRKAARNAASTSDFDDEEFKFNNHKNQDNLLAVPTKKKLSKISQTKAFKISSSEKKGNRAQMTTGNKEIDIGKASVISSQKNEIIHLKEPEKQYKFQSPYASHYKLENMLPPLPTSYITRTLGVDTRAFSIFEDDASSKHFLDLCLNFIISSSHRGTLPLLLTNSSAKINVSNGNEKSLGVEVHNLLLDFFSTPAKKEHGEIGSDFGLQIQKWKHILEPVLLNITSQTIEDCSQNLKRNKIPEVLAQDSWDHFNKMVETLVNRAFEEPQLYCDLGKEKPSFCPISITIFTKDATFFSEDDDASHTNALDKFCHQIEKSFDDNYISSILIVIVQTNTSPQQLNIKYTQTFQMLQHHLKTRKNSHIQQAQPVSLTLEMIQSHSISTSRITRSWIRQALPNPYVAFTLPQLIDDNCQCTLSFVLEYAIMPSSLYSAESWALIRQCKLMEQSKWEVVTIMKISDINLSLIYGVNMIAKAGIEDHRDFDAYKDMKKLVQQLWKYLHDRDSALLLRIIPEELCGAEYYFILLVDSEENSNCKWTKQTDVQKQSINISYGRLFRYAINEQLIWDTENDCGYDMMEHVTIGEDDEQEYYSYIERSLNNIDQGTFNPFLRKGTNLDRRMNDIIDYERQSEKRIY